RRHVGRHRQALNVGVPEERRTSSRGFPPGNCIAVGSTRQWSGARLGHDPGAATPSTSSWRSDERQTTPNRGPLDDRAGELSRAEFRGGPGARPPARFGLWRDGQLVATGQTWDGPTDTLIVLFDPDGRVIERAYLHVRVERHWVRELRAAIGPLCPF